MEPVNGTPNENEYKGDDIKLRVELNAALESELSKSPDEMNTEKIDSIIELLNRLDEDSSTEQEMSKDQFAEKYLKGVIKYRERGAGYFKVAIIFVGLILCVSVCNFISVRATSKSLFFLAKEKAKKILPPSQNVKINRELLERLYQEFGENNVKVLDKGIENISKMN